MSEDKFATASLTYKFTSSAKGASSGSAVPSIRSGYSSSKEVAIPESIAKNKCVTVFHSYGEAPSQVFHSGHGSFTHSSGGTESFKETISVSGSNTAQTSGVPKGGVSFSEVNLTLIKEEILPNSTKKFVGSSSNVTPVVKSGGMISLSENDADKFYGNFVATYSTSKTLYFVNLDGLPCPETKGVTAPIETNFTITALFSNGASSASGGRDSQCCSDKKKKIDDKTQPVSGNMITGQTSSGASNGCIKVLHVYGVEASKIDIIKGPIASTEDYGGYSEYFEETLIFNGSTSVSLQHPAQGTVIIEDMSEFRGSGYYAIYDPEDVEFKNPTKGEYSNSMGAPSLAYNKDTNAIEAAKDIWIVEPKYFGAVVVSYTAKRYDYLIEFSTDYCPDNNDSPESRKYKEEKSKGLLFLEYSNGTVGTVQVDRDSSCCPDMKKEGYVAENYVVQCEAISAKEEYESRIEDMGPKDIKVREYVLLKGYGQYEFDIAAYSIKSGIFGNTSGGDVKSISLRATKVYNKVQPYTETLPIKSANSGKLKSIPIDPTWSPIGPFTPDVPIEGGSSGIYVAFGAKKSQVYEGEYDGYKRTFRITGTKYLRPDEFALVDKNGVMVSCSGSIKVTYNIRYSVYELNYVLPKTAFRDPTHNVQYMFRYFSDGFSVTGETVSDLSVNNTVSKKEIKYLRDLFGQSQ